MVSYVDGPAGVGKTELAKVLSKITDAKLIRLQCYEGIDYTKVLYEIEYNHFINCLEAS